MRIERGIGCGLALVAAAGLAGCAGHRARSPGMISVTPPPVEHPQASAPLPTVPGQLAAIWQLRVALNVAALECRGAAAGGLVSGYNGMLRKRRELLGAAQADLVAHYAGLGPTGYDRAMTRLYNLYAQRGLRTGFCQSAARIQHDEPQVPAAAFASFAAQSVADLDSVSDRASPAVAPSRVVTATAHHRPRGRHVAGHHPH